VSEDPLESDPLDTGTEELAGTVVRGAGLAGLGFALAQALTLGFYLALARLASPADFGEFAAASIVVNTSLLLSEAGMLSAVIHRADRVDEAANTAVIASAASGLAFGLFALATAPLVGHLFHSSRIGDLAAAMSGLLLVRNLHIAPQALLQRRFSFLRRMVVEPAQAIAFGVVAVIATSNGMGPWGLVLGYYAAATADSALSWGLGRWRPHLGRASMSMWRELIAYGRHIIASHAVLRIGDQVPVLLLGRFVGAGPLGQYRYADRIASTPFSMILAAGAYVLFPAFARIRDDRARLRSAFENSLRWLAVVAFPLGLILIPLGPPLAVIVFGSVWRGAGEAAIALCVYPAAATMVSLTSEVFKADGHVKPLVRVMAVIGVTGAIAMVALLGFDLVGVAAGISIGWVAGAAYALWLAGGRLELGLGQIARQLWAPALAGLVMAGALLPIDRLWLDPTAHANPAAVLLLALEGLAGLVIYALLLLALRRSLAAELRSLLSTALNRGEGPARAS
jgi:PST family polysaccharide transporter